MLLTFTKRQKHFKSSLQRFWFRCKGNQYLGESPNKLYTQNTPNSIGVFWVYNETVVTNYLSDHCATTTAVFSDAISYAISSVSSNLLIRELSKKPKISSRQEHRLSKCPFLTIQVSVSRGHRYSSFHQTSSKRKFYLVFAPQTYIFRLW